MAKINVSLDAFEGPLDLLLHLIEKNEIDIYNIPIAKLAEQYMEYIDYFSLGDMEDLSEFLVMAATLLEIKSKMLLPVDKKEGQEEEEDPREALVKSLIEYKRYKNVIVLFKEKEEKASKYAFRQPEQRLLEMLKAEKTVDYEDLLGGLTHSQLYKIFENCLKNKALKTDVVRSGFNSVTKDVFTVDEKIEQLITILKRDRKIVFSELINKRTPKIERVVTFLAILEIVKTHNLYVNQEKLFGNIEITLERGLLP